MKMFSKIFKTEFVKNVKTFLIIMGAMLGISLVSGILGLASYGEEDGQTVGWLTFACGLINFLTYPIILFGFASLVYVLFGSFYRAVATDEAYLTFTLPASMKEQFFARLLVIIVWLAIFFAVMMLSYFVAFMPMRVKNGIIILGPSFGEIFQNMTVDSFFTTLEVFLLIAGGALFLISAVVFAILFSNRISRRKKVGKVIGTLVLMGFFLEVAFAFLLSGLVNSGFFNVSVHVVLWFFILLVAGLDFLMLFFSYRFLSKGLNVD